MLAQETIDPFGEVVATKPTGSLTGVESSVTERSVLSEASDFLSAANNLSGQTKMAVKNRDYAWLGKLRGFALRLKTALVEFVVKAIELAIFKFIVELCAMVMNSIMDALKKRGKPALDISSGGVMYAGNSTLQQNQTNYSQVNPFSNSSYRGTASPSSIAPW